MVSIQKEFLIVLMIFKFDKNNKNILDKLARLAVLEELVY
jgi:hypothetical protein